MEVIGQLTLMKKEGGALLRRTRGKERAPLGGKEARCTQLGGKETDCRQRGRGEQVDGYILWKPG